MMDLVKALANDSHRRIEIRENDYKKDGLWYCGSCHTQKQYIRQVGDIFINAMCLCKCQAEAYAREEAYYKEKERKKGIDRNRVECFPVVEMGKATFDMDDGKNPKITEICKRYCENFKEAREDGVGLMFYGNVGTGKSFFAACIANELISQEYVVAFDNCRGYADMAFEDKEVFHDTITYSDLLVLDDMGMERETEYMKETLFQILDKRCQAGKPIIVTTNLTADQLKAPRNTDEERVFSRLLNKTVPVLMKGEDRRRENGRATNEEWRARLLGREENV